MKRKLANTNTMIELILSKKSAPCVCRGLVACLIFLLFNQSAIWAQGLSIELAPFAGYRFGGSFEIPQGDLDIIDDLQVGLALDVPLRAGVKGTLMWSWQPSELEVKRTITGVTERPFKLDVHYIHVGGVYETVHGGNAVPFGLFTLGATLYHARASDISDEWRFSVALGGGVKVYTSDRFGLRFQARALFTQLFGAGSLWCGPAGCTVGVGSTTVIEGEVSGGLFFLL